MKINKELKAKISKKRREFTITGLAKKCGISRVYLSNMIHGRKNMPTKIEKKLNKILGE